MDPVGAIANCGKWISPGGGVELQIAPLTENSVWARLLSSVFGMQDCIASVQSGTGFYGKGVQLVSPLFSLTQVGPNIYDMEYQSTSAYPFQMQRTDGETSFAVPGRWNTPRVQTELLTFPLKNQRVSVTQTVYTDAAKKAHGASGLIATLADDGSGFSPTGSVSVQRLGGNRAGIILKTADGTSTVYQPTNTCPW